MSRSAVRYRQATWLDLLLLIPRLRQADIDECEALFGRHSIGPVASETYRNSQMRIAAEVDGVVVAMFGVAAQSLLSNVGHPWMFGRPEMETHARALMQEGRKYIDEMLGLYPRLENVVDARNTKSIRWLRYLGFTFGDAVIVGVEARAFYPFVMEV
jgi:hypothetical protein